MDDLYAAAGCRGGVVQSRARRWAYEHVRVCDGVRRDPWRKALRSTVVGGRGLTTSVSLIPILFIMYAGRMLWRGSGNGTRMRVCGTSCCACCVVVCGACCGGGEMSIRTNLWDKGLISAGRSAKTTPLLTIPRHIFKSSTRDLSLPIFGIMFLLTQYMMLTFRLSLFALHRQR